MRTQEEWRNHIFPKVLKNLSPRLQKDLETLPVPKDMPELDSYYLYGEVGAGKTVLAARLYVEARRLRYFMKIPDGDILFVSVPDFFNEVKASYENNVKSEQAILDKYSNANILILDDLGAERVTDWMVSLLYILINRRYENLLTTIITSNFNLDELDDRLGNSKIPSRIGRMCKVLHIIDE